MVGLKSLSRMMRGWCTIVALISLGLLSSFNARVPNAPTDSPISEKKAQFFRYLTPRIDAVNARIQRHRAMLVALQRRNSDPAAWLSRDRRWFAQMVQRYQVDGTLTASEQLTELLRRIDEVPKSLALSQGAIESGWGQSWVAQDLHNVFGRHCFRRGCGIAHPVEGGMRYATFRRPELAIQTYIHDLNTHAAYNSLRTIRADANNAGGPASGHQLAPGLSSYSARGQAYVQQVQRFIRDQRLDP